MSAFHADRRFEQVRPGLRFCAFLSGALLAAAISLAAFTYGDEPIVTTNLVERTVIAGIGCLSLIGLAFSGGLLAGQALLRRFSPSWRRPG